MARRNVFSTGNGIKTQLYQSNNETAVIKDFRWITNFITKILGTGYTVMSGHYMTIVTVFAVVLLSYIIPDVSQKIHATNDLKDMNKVLNMISNEVNRAEAACFTAADEVCYLRCSMHDDATETSRNLQDLSVCTSRCMHTTQSEPVQVEKKIGFFRRIFFPNRNASYKEFTIMSYLYTDSFDAEKKLMNNI